jgi:hypothetical protein
MFLNIISGVRHLASGIGCQASGVRHLASGIRFKVSDNMDFLQPEARSLVFFLHFQNIIFVHSVFKYPRVSQSQLNIVILPGFLSPL